MAVAVEDDELRERAEAEWASVQEVVLQQGDKRIRFPIPSLKLPEAEDTTVTVDQVVADFEAQDLSRQIAEVEADLARHRQQSVGLVWHLKRIKALATGQRWRLPRLRHTKLVREKTLVMAVAKCPFDDANRLHLEVLTALYVALVPEPRGPGAPPARYGPHWENIGFQGDNPATDLRGVGFLGLLQMLHFVTSGPRLLSLARSLHALSISPDQEFPLMVLSINVTRIALHALRDGLLNRICNDLDSVWEAFNRFYVAVMFHIYDVWKTQNKTIVDSGYVLKDAEKRCRLGVKEATLRLSQHLDSL